MRGLHRFFGFDLFEFEFIAQRRDRIFQVAYLRHQRIVFFGADGAFAGGGAGG